MKNFDINDLISKVDIVSVISNFSTILKSGASFKTLCNVHGDKSPSLSINPKKQIYKCFVCDHGGNALDYLIWSQKFTFQQAIEYLIKESGEDIEKFSKILKIKKYSEKHEKLFKATQDASDLFNYYLSIYIDEENDLKKFIQDRKIEKKLIDEFKIGYAPLEINYIDILEKKGNEKSVLINASLISENNNFPFFVNRIIFPIFDEENNIVAFSGRLISNSLDNKTKYLNSKESLIFKKSNIIYNYNNAKTHESIIIVEGFMDVISMAKIGFINCVALMGLNLSEHIINKFKKHKEILIFLDNDEAGQKATLKIIWHFLINDINSYVILNNYLKDPDEIINSENGVSKIKDLFSNKINNIDFLILYFTKNIEKENYTDLKKAIIELGKFSSQFDNLLKMDIINKLSKRFDIAKENITKYFNHDLNMIKFNYSEHKKYIETKKNLEDINIKEPLNINKILISIWQNPAFLKSNNIENLNWPTAETMKIYREIKQHYQKGDEISEKTKKFIKEKLEIFKSPESLPKDIESFNELIERARNDFYNNKINDIDKIFLNTNDDNLKKDLIIEKLEIIKKLKKGEN